MTMIQPRVPEFPEHPEDGFQIKEELPNGGYAIWTYRAQFNEWTCELYTGNIPGYVTTRQVLTVGPSVLADGSQPSILETQEQVNNTIASVAQSAVKASGRTTDQVDFLQNSIGKGTWIHVLQVLGSLRRSSSGPDGQR